MPKFRKKPVVIEAFRWWGDGDSKERDFPVLGRDTEGRPFSDVSTPEGTMRVSEGDWIITGVEGEQYPCKPNIFAATYEPVVEGDKDA